MTRRSSWRRTVAVVVALAAAGALIGTLLRPGAGSIDHSTDVEGDTELAAAAVDVVPERGVYALSVAEVTPDGTRTATVGAPLDGTFEIGSVSKAATGLLYAEAVERGEITPESTLGEIFDLGDAEANSVTLEELSQHRSGLPRLPLGLSQLIDSYRWLLLAQNPYNDEPSDVIDDLRTASVGSKDPAYSNLGFAVLGHALAEVSETDYPDLVRTRLAEPLGAEAFYVPPPGEGGTHQQAVRGREASGRAQQPWDDSGYAPAGGIRTDAASMARLAEALLDGSSPGATALDPATDFNEHQQIGAGWMVGEVNGQEVTWHNGQTGGFSTWFGIDRDSGAAVFISGATTHDLDSAGQALLRHAGERDKAGDRP